MNRTKIICTAGPSVNTPERMVALIENGMSVLRINCSHGNFEQYEKTVALVRDAEAKTGRNVSVMIDLQGPKLRVGDLPQPLWLERDDIWQLSSTQKADEKKKIIPIKIKDFAKCVSVGGKIYMDDGLLEAEVTKKDDDTVWARIHYGGILQSRKGMNIPYYQGNISAITAKDKEDLIWGLKAGVDSVALSFVRQAKDIIDLKKLIAKHQTTTEPLVFAKIEKPEAVECMEEIIRESDGVLVARGDLGIELQQEKVPVVQKQIIEVSRFLKKPNIVATQMLDSMRNNPIPTRAEVSDVASAIFSGADALLLTGETSSGKYPVEACATMNRIIGEVESHLLNRETNRRSGDFKLLEYEETFLFHAMQMANELNVQAIIMLTKAGRLIKIASKFHAKQPLYCLAPTVELARKINHYWGVCPINISDDTVDDRIKAGVRLLSSQKVIRTGDRVLFIFRDYQSKTLNLKVREI